MQLAILLTLFLQTPSGAPAQEPAAPTSVPFPDDLLDEPRYTYARLTGRSTGLSQLVTFDAGDDFLEREWYEQDPSTPDLVHEFTLEERLPFSLTDVAWREGGNELFVAGMRKDGSAVIELFKGTPRVGGYHLRTVHSGPTPLGHPLSAHVYREELTGGTFIPPQESPPAPCARRVLFAGSKLGLVRRMVADPNGRYLLLLTYPKDELYQLDLATSAPEPRLLYSPASLPELRGARTLDLMRHKAEGLLVVVTPAEGRFVKSHVRIVLPDPDNDGVFDAPALLDGEQWRTRYPYTSLGKYFVD